MTLTSRLSRTPLVSGWRVGSSFLYNKGCVTSSSARLTTSCAENNPNWISLLDVESDPHPYSKKYYADTFYEDCLEQRPPSYQYNRWNVQAGSDEVQITRIFGGGQRDWGDDMQNGDFCARRQRRARCHEQEEEDQEM